MGFWKNMAAKINLQMTVVSLCIFCVCIASQRMQTAAWDVGIIEFSRDSMGVLMAVILLTHYKWDDFKKYKIPYLVWSVAGILAMAAGLPIAFRQRQDYLRADSIIIALGIFLLGYCLIHTFISFFIEKYRPKLYRPLLLVWIVMLVLMIFSRSDYLWPECYFVLFLCYYMTPQTSEQRRNVVIGLVNGMILGYAAVQTHALICRPYDKARYQGNFCNPNHNCMFLCMCLTAILSKLLYVTKENKRRLVRIFYFLLAESCLAFICMTACRSGYLAAFVVVVFFLIAYCVLMHKKVFIRMGLLLAVLFAAALPLTYLAVRYVPTVHPHVVFYFQEGYSESWVHSWDPRDSEKYVTFEQMLYSVFGRFSNFKDAVDNLKEKESAVPKQEMMQLAYESRYMPAYLAAAIEAEILEAEGSKKTPALTSREAANSIVVRMTIYEWYFTHLSWRGMPYDEQGFQLTESHWIQDTHNIYLDYGINFGFPVMILFTVFIWWGIGRLVRQGIKTRQVEKWICLLIALVPPVFGLFEFSWGAGMISTVAFYMAFKEMFTD